ncbi:MAG: SPOR domain-containing protein [Thiotrichaceae bacterium]|nr:SPOR domain-containing protein [Thiotrichaceae bacterium]
MEKKQQGFLKLKQIILLILLLCIGIGAFLYNKGHRLHLSNVSDSDTIEMNNEASNDENNYQQKTTPTETMSHPPATQAVKNDNYSYIVQVTTTPYRKQANKLLQGLRRDGYHAKMFSREEDNGYVYRVHVGPYNDKQTASAVTSQIRKRYRKLRDSFYRRLDN